MLTSIITSAVAYISTNIDDIFVVMILLTQAAGGEKGKLAAGHFLGVGVITAISMLGALGLENLPLKYVGLLGLVPIGLGIKAWLDSRKGTQDSDASDVRVVGALSMAMITVGNGADNLGVYIPLLTGFSNAQRLAAAAVFAGMTALWIFLANSLAEFPGVKAVVGRYRNILIPVVYIFLGVYILLDSGLLG